MSELAVITPTWRPDGELFAELHRSVLEHAPEDTVHHLIVPWLHRRWFTKYAGERCRVWSHPELMPRNYVRLPGGIWINTRRGWPPIRGWVMQQAAKIAVAGLVDADVALLIDSDAVLVRPVTAERFRDRRGAVRLFRDEGAVSPDMERHVIWHRVARELLGLPTGDVRPPLPDYVSPLGIWEPAVVRAMQARIAETTGRGWLEAFTSRLHVSEFIVYGVFVDHLGDSRPESETAVCHNSWARTPFDHDEALAFAERLGPDAVAMMISSHSNTPVDIRRAAEERALTVR